MASPLGIRLAYCAVLTLTLSAGVSSVHAASGSISFSGAIMEPTCSTAGLASVDSGVTGSSPQRLHCGDNSASPGRSYSRQVLDLAEANPHNDRLLDYFASYASLAAGGDAARVVVHTYD